MDDLTHVDVTQLDPSASVGTFAGVSRHPTIEGGVGDDVPLEPPATFAESLLAVGGGAR
jgi:hypothetical protein